MMETRKKKGARIGKILKIGQFEKRGGTLETKRTTMDMGHHGEHPAITYSEEIGGWL